MEFKRLSLNDAARLMDAWIEAPEEYIENMLDKDYDEIRQDLISGFETVDKEHKYACDYQFGLSLTVNLTNYGFIIVVIGK